MSKALALPADSTRGKFAIQPKATFGFLIAHRPSLEPLQETHAKGFEVAAIFPSRGKHRWEHMYMHPTRGITLAWFDLGSKERLGSGLALYPWINFPLTSRGENGLNFRYGIGIGYVEKTFDRETNFKNMATGSHINGIIHFDLNWQGKLSQRTLLEVGAGITHYSNGSVNLPNLGLNIATANLGLTHYLGERIVRESKTLKPPRLGCSWEIFAGAFPKRIYPPFGEMYMSANLSVLRLRMFNTKSSFGLGHDLMYDNSIGERIRRLEGEAKPLADNFRGGIFGAYHFGVGRMGFMVNMGYYYYNPWKEDGNVYHRVCLRYYMKKFFAGFNLKTHYARADYFELGAGIRL